jgi:predicted Holliday junction resolvase-like endonuclease
VSGMVNLFQQARSVLCLCPCCGEIVRVSDLRLKYKGVTPLTWLDKYDQKVSKFELREAEFKASEFSIREESREKGRRKARKSVMKMVRKVLPGCDYHPQDIKALLHPVDYVVFCGMTEGKSVDKVVLLSTETDDKILKRIRPSIEKAINSQEYSWSVARVLDDGTVKCGEK